MKKLLLILSLISTSGCVTTRLLNTETCEAYHDTQNKVDIYVCRDLVEIRPTK